MTVTHANNILHDLYAMVHLDLCCFRAHYMWNVERESKSHKCKYY